MTEQAHVRGARLLLLPLLLLSACKVDQEREMSQYRTVLATTAPTTVPALKGRLTLPVAMSLANQNSERLAREGETYVQAIIAMDRASAAFWPTVSFTPSYTRRDRFGSSGTVAAAAEHNTLSGTLGLDQTIYDAGARKAQLAAGTRSVDQRRSLLLDLQASLMLEVAQTFYQVLKTEERAVSLAARIQTLEELVRITEARRAAGMAREVEVAEAQGQVASARMALIAARNDIRNGRSLLSLLTHADVTGVAIADALKVPATLPSVVDWQQRALVQRQDYLATRAGIDIAEADLKGAIAKYYPSVTINPDLVATATPSGSEWGWMGILQANVPIFSAGRIHADVRTAWSRVRQAKLAVEQVRREVELDVELAHQDWSASLQGLRQREVEADVANTALLQARQGQSAGLATEADLLVAQARAVEAEAVLASQKLDTKVLYLRLLRSAGALGVDPSRPITPATTQAAKTAQ